MTSPYQTMEDLREAGMAALVKELGPVDAVRFVRMLRPGEGDYTRDRHKILGNPTLEELFADLDRWKAAKAQPDRPNTP